MVLIQILVGLIVAIFLAINMGASGTAPAMATGYGSEIIKKKHVPILFTAFVFLGAIVGSSKVVKTISEGLIPESLIDFNIAIIILSTSAIVLLASNYFKIPSSTSQVTVLAIVGVGLYSGSIHTDTFVFMVPMWFILPVMAFGISYVLEKIAYKWIIERVRAKRYQCYLKWFVIGTCLYVAFAIGTNNVANVVGPLVAAGMIAPFVGIILIAPIFGLGSYLMGGRVIETVGKDITELNAVRSSIDCAVTGTLLIFASSLGIPQSIVQLNACTIMGIGAAGKLNHNTVKKLLSAWIIGPIIALIISFILISILFFVI
jgi:sulfate permease